MEKLKILHVEDNEDELHLVRQAFEEIPVSVHLRALRDGEEAIQYLRTRNSPEHPRPDIVLLDLNLPKKNGFEVLTVIKTDSGLKNIPVLIFTGSQSQDDVYKAYDLHANSYIRKPSDFSEYIAFLSRVVDFWGDTVVFSRP